MRLISRRSRRIQRNLRLIDAAQNGCWTAPCSPVVPVFKEKISRQPEAQMTRDVCYTRVQSWYDLPFLPVGSEVLNFLKSEI